MAFSATRLHVRAATKVPALARGRSSVTSPPSIVDAKARVREHARNISRSSTNNAVPAPAVRPAQPPDFQQALARNNLPSSTINGPGPLPNAPLDHTFVGMTGGQIFLEMIVRHGVEKVFGYPGGAILPVFDAIYNSDKFEFVLPKHEQGAGHMAEGYARVSGKPGVVLVTSGPGATNVVTAMQDALSDGVPLVVFSGQVATSAIGSDAFQEADVIGISRSCTKWNVMIKDISEMPRRINEAFKIAMSGRPGPVLVDLPKDVTAGILRTPLPYKATTPGVPLNIPMNPLSPLEPPADAKLIKQAADLINQAQRPVIFAGHGILSSPDAPRLLAELSERGNIPVCTSLLGLGAFDEQNERSLHMMGMHGSPYSNLAIQTADVVIALGVRFDDRTTGRVDSFAPAARLAAKEDRGGIIHFEIMPKNINKVVQASIPVLGDVATSLKVLVPWIEHSPRNQWFSDIADWKHKFPFTYVKSDPSKGECMKPQEVIEELERQTAHKKDDVIITTGVGQHQMWAAQHYRWKLPNTLITSGGLGTMGFGLPAAIGAKIAAPTKTVIDIDGDASFTMTGMELATAWQYNIGVKALIMNNEQSGMVLQWQDLFYDSRHSHSVIKNPNFLKLANALGVHAIRCESADELPAKMKEFLEYDETKPVLLDCVVERTEHVYPMVVAGKPLHEQVMHPKLNEAYKKYCPKIQC